MRAKLDELTLSNKAIWDREHARPQIKCAATHSLSRSRAGLTPPHPRAPWIIKAPYFILCYMLDNIFDGRALARLWFLETVARVPYFSYISMLHLYESIGWWRIGAASKRVHFAEEVRVCCCARMVHDC
jgi:ubiquinol oxidase